MEILKRNPERDAGGYEEGMFGKKDMMVDRGRLIWVNR